MPKNWKLKPEPSKELLSELSEYPPFVVQLLYNRGLVQREEIQKFLNPKYQDQNDPFLFQDMEKAVERIWQAIEKNEGICIYGDYDADAVTANSVVQLGLRYVGKNVNSYIPDRFTEGYGLNLQAFEKIYQDGCKVVITVDCGTNSVDVAEFCKEKGIDLIITDHHEIIGPVPDAYALINPKNPNDNYPYHEITGVGVAFKLIQAVLSKKEKVAMAVTVSSKANKQISNGEPPLAIDGYEKWLLDLVAIGTVADCHSLMGENRILVKFGLKVLAKTKWTGLRALVSTAGLDFIAKPPDTYTLGFVIAPRLNAAGRLEHADTALHLVLEQDPVTAVQRSQQLEAINERRQEQTKRIVSEARERAEQIADRKVIIVAGEGWNKGIVGLVAGKLAEEFHKPVMVLEKGIEESTGSARTVGDFNVVEALKHAAEYLTRFGGHTQAAGLSLKTENFDKFYQKVLEYAEIELAGKDQQSQLELDAALQPEDITMETLGLISAMEPFGVDNVKPKFLISNTRILSIRTVGKESQHLQIKLKIGDKEIGSILFSASDFAKNLKIGDTIDVAAEISENIWNGRSSIQLRIVDLRAHA
jgi:single-stranded-DNA-specific exonuclease